MYGNQLVKQMDFYPRSPRGERLSRNLSGTRLWRYFYPRSPRGERPLTIPAWLNTMAISIHAPLAGSDFRRFSQGLYDVQFLSTLPSRGATLLRGCYVFWKRFLSTLPSRGATAGLNKARPPSTNFYPRSPRGERPQSVNTPIPLWAFLSTLPSRGATTCYNIIKR